MKKHKHSLGLSIRMSIPTVLGVYGESDSGKTNLIVTLLSHLTKEGYRVATIKQTNKSVSMDTQQKDTWRHREAGAGLVVFASHRETDFLIRKKYGTSEIIRRITQFGIFDLVLIEGADDPEIPKIQLGSGEKRRNTIATYKGDLEEILTIIKLELKKITRLPALHVTVNGKVVPLTEFPETIITQTIMAMLSSLKGVSDIRQATIELER
jgi:molybdopterin-guanine dinucleotide biosynthesis protein MobB